MTNKNQVQSNTISAFLNAHQELNYSKPVFLSIGPNGVQLIIGKVSQLI